MCVCVSRMALTLRWTALFRASRFTHHVAHLPACPKKSPPDPRLVPSQRIRSGSRYAMANPAAAGEPSGKKRKVESGAAPYVPLFLPTFLGHMVGVISDLWVALE